VTDRTASAAYIAAVRTELAGVPGRVREEALAELDSLLYADAGRRGEAAALEALGPAVEYARSVRIALLGSDDATAPQGHVLGMPYDFRGASVERIASRMWNPTDRRVFTPRLFGVGWTINFGAIAVRLGLIRPDDIGEEALARIPGPVVAVALAVPALLALATTTLVAFSWGSLPAEVPVHWGVSGAPDDWASKGVAFGMILALGALPVVIAYARVLRRGTPKRSRVLTAAAFGLIAVVGLGLALITVVDARGGSSGGYMVAVILAGLGVSFLLLYVPARLGLRAEWQATLRSPEEGS